jgi:hypothetical protein
MMVSMDAFTDEMVKIAGEGLTKDDLKTFAKHLAVYGGGLGVGSGIGYAVRKKVLPHVLPRMKPWQRTGLTIGSGALGGLASAAAMRHALFPKKDEEEEGTVDEP